MNADAVEHGWSRSVVCLPTFMTPSHHLVGNQHPEAEDASPRDPWVVILMMGIDTARLLRLPADIAQTPVKPLLTKEA